MSPSTFEKAMFSLVSWSLASALLRTHEPSTDASLGIACVLRNRVVDAVTVTGLNGMPTRKENPAFSTYAKVFTELGEVHHVLPDFKNESFFSPYRGHLALCEQIYDGRFPDSTASSANPAGARIFCRPGEGPSGASPVAILGGVYFYA